MQLLKLILCEAELLLLVFLLVHELTDAGGKTLYQRILRGSRVPHSLDVLISLLFVIGIVVCGFFFIGCDLGNRSGEVGPHLLQNANHSSRVLAASVFSCGHLGCIILEVLAVLVSRIDVDRILTRLQERASVIVEVEGVFHSRCSFAVRINSNQVLLVLFFSELGRLLKLDCRLVDLEFEVCDLSQVFVLAGALLGKKSV
mmetsp:Transcript_62809/g.111581  ORF Transcript_62809/g.111581 Transcript_62809/m.111581 type:complete len:201 (+) Transcript_62809:225-827(+)